MEYPSVQGRCVWPTWPKYIGGDPNVAASFTCVNDEVHRDGEREGGDERERE